MITIVVTTLLGAAFAQNACVEKCAFLRQGTTTATAEQKATCCSCVKDPANAVPSEFVTLAAPACGDTPPNDRPCAAECPFLGTATRPTAEQTSTCCACFKASTAQAPAVCGGDTTPPCASECTSTGDVAPTAEQAKKCCLCRAGTDATRQAACDTPPADRPCAAECTATGDVAPTAEQAKKCCLCRAGTDATRQAACDGGLVNNGCAECLLKARAAADPTTDLRACYGTDAPCPVPEPRDACATCGTDVESDTCTRCKALTTPPTTGTTDPATRPCATECNADTATSAEGRKACCVCAYKTRAGDSATREGAEAACAPVDTRPPETCASKCASATTDGATARACFDRCTAPTGGVDEPTVRPTCADVCAANAKRAEAATTDAAKAFSLDACTAACARREQADSLGDRVVAHCTKDGDATPTADGCRAAVTDEIKQRCDAIPSDKPRPPICKQDVGIADRLRSLAETDPAKARELADRVREAADEPKPAADVVARLQDAAKRCAAAEPGSEAATRCADAVAKARAHLQAARDRAVERAKMLAKRVCAGRLNADDKKRLPDDVDTAELKRATNPDGTDNTGDERKRNDAAETTDPVEPPKVEGDKATCVARIRQVFATVRRAQFCAIKKRLEAFGVEVAAVEDKEIDCAGQQRKRQSTENVGIVAAGSDDSTYLLIGADGVVSIDGQSTAEQETVVVDLKSGTMVRDEPSDDAASLALSAATLLVAVLAL